MIKYILACAAFFTFPFDANAAPTVYGDNVSIATVSTGELTRGQKVGLRKFKGDRGYFGTFYVAQDNEAWYFVSNFHALSAAHKFARKGCEIMAKGSPCTLYAISFPTGANPNDTGLSGLSWKAAKDFKRRYARDQTSDGFGAFAVSGGGEYGGSYGWSDEILARDRALASCERSAAKTLQSIPRALKDWTRQNNISECKVVDVYRPSQ